MMPEREYICPRCGRSVSASSGTRVKKRVYHQKCYKEKIAEDVKKESRKKQKTQVQKAQPDKPKVIEVPEAVPENIAKEREHFFEKVKKLTGNKSLTAKTYALADRYKRDYKDFTWANMEKTLIYVYELDEVEIGDDIVGIIPWKYAEAMEFYNELDRISPSSKKIEDMYKKRKIKIRPKHEEKPSIDISQLGVD